MELFEFLFRAWRKRRVECELWNGSRHCEIFFSEPNGEKHSLCFPESNVGELTRVAKLPNGRSAPWVHYEALAAIFILHHSHSSFAFSLLCFFHSASFPSDSVRCQVGSCCHRNHKCLWLSLSVLVFLFCLSVRLSLFFFFFLRRDKYLFPRHLRGRWEVWWGGLEWNLRI